MKNLSLLCSFGLILTAFIWGFAFVVVKDSLDVIGPLWMVAVRFSIAAIFLTLICVRQLKNFNKSIMVHGFILGVMLFAAYSVQTVGCKYTTAGKNAFLTTVYVILTPLFGWPVFKKVPKWYVWLAAVMSLTGIGFLSLGGNDADWYIMNKGDVLTLICGVLYALHIVFGAKYVAKENAVLLTVMQFVTCGILGFIIAPIFEGKTEISVFTNAKTVLSILYLGLLSSMLCFVLQNVCLKYVPSALASLFLSLESVFGVFFSTIFLHEKLTVRMWVGCALIFTAILTAEIIPEFFKKKSSD